MVSSEEQTSFIEFAYNAGLTDLTAQQQGIRAVNECYTFADDILSYKGLKGVPKQLRDEVALVYMRLVIQQGRDLTEVGDEVAAAISGKELDATKLPDAQYLIEAGRSYAQAEAGAQFPTEREKRAIASSSQFYRPESKFKRNAEGNATLTIVPDAGTIPASARQSKGREYPAGEFNADEGKVVYRQRSSAFHALVDDPRSVLQTMIEVERTEENAGGKYPTLSAKAMGNYNNAGGASYVRGRIPNPFDMRVGEFPTPDLWKTSVLINLRNEMAAVWADVERTTEKKVEDISQKFRSYVADIVEFSSPGFARDMTRWSGVSGIRLDPEGRRADGRVLEGRAEISLDWMLSIGDSYTSTMRSKFDRTMNRIFGMYDEENMRSKSLSSIWADGFKRLVSYNKGNADFMRDAKEGLEQLARRHKNELDPMHNAVQGVLASVQAELAPKRYSPKQQPQMQ